MVVGAEEDEVYNKQKRNTIIDGHYSAIPPLDSPWTPFLNDILVGEPVDTSSISTEEIMEQGAHMMIDTPRYVPNNSILLTHNTAELSTMFNKYPATLVALSTYAIDNFMSPELTDTSQKVQDYAKDLEIPESVIREYIDNVQKFSAMISD